MEKKVQNISRRRSGPIALGSFEELANQQGVTPIDNFETLLGIPSPEDESAEEFSGMLREWRRKVTGTDRSQ